MGESIHKLKNRALVSSNFRRKKEKELKRVNIAIGTYETTSSRSKFALVNLRRKGEEYRGRNLFNEIMVENFPGLGKETNIRI